MGVPVQNFQGVRLVIFRHDPQQHSLLLHLQENSLEIFIGQTSVVLRQFHRSVFLLPCQTAPQRIIQIQEKHFLRNPLFHPNLIQDQSAQPFLGLAAKRYLSHIPHFHGKRMVRSQFLHQPPEWKYPHVLPHSADLFQTLLPQSFQRRLPPRIRQHGQFRSP